MEQNPDILNDDKIYLKMRVLSITIMLSFYAIVAISQDQYEYLTIAQRKDEIQISSVSKGYEVSNIPYNQAKGYNNYYFLLQKVEEFEKEGWEMVSNQVAYGPDGYVSHIFLMRKRKK